MQEIKNIRAKELVPGITGYYAHGTSMSFGYVELLEGAFIPEHSHIHEQITFIIDGQLDMIIDGQPRSLTPGMYFVIPSNVKHSAKAKTFCKVIDAFSPVRDDYKQPG